MARHDRAIEAFGKRFGYSPARARTEAERRIRVAVNDYLAGDQTALDRVPDELRPEARQRAEERLAAGEGAPGVLRISGLTGRAA